MSLVPGMFENKLKQESQWNDDNNYNNENEYNVDRCVQYHGI
jgi:hypothetical protein